MSSTICVHSVYKVAEDLQLGDQETRKASGHNWQLRKLTAQTAYCRNFFAVRVVNS